MRIGNDISNRAILNTMTNIRLAGEVIYYFSREAQNEYRRQHRMTQFFDNIEDNQTVTINNNTNGATNTDVNMSVQGETIRNNASNVSNGD